MIPSIDLLDGKVVVMQQGKTVAMELKESAMEIAERLSSFPEVQVIDLNAAFAKGNNEATVKRLCGIVSSRVGGGIRTIEKAKEAVSNGARKVIVGTMANREFLLELCKKIGKERIIVALDSRNGKIVVNGWQKETGETIKEKAAELEQYCSEFLFSFAEKDGTMEGVDFKRVKGLKSLTRNKITIAGGISTKEEIEKLEKIGIDCVVGMALYTGKIGGLK